MRMGQLVLVGALAPALLAAQAKSAPLSYRGWALGIPLDSATTLTTAQIGAPLVCVGDDMETMFCETNDGVGHASLYFSPIPRRLEELNIMRPLDRRASRDSLEKWFAARWGPPLPRPARPKPSQKASEGAVIGDIVGRWTRGGFVYGMVAVAGLDTTRILSVAISNPARRIRLMMERGDTTNGRK